MSDTESRISFSSRVVVGIRKVGGAPFAGIAARKVMTTAKRGSRCVETIEGMFRPLQQVFVGGIPCGFKRVNKKLFGAFFQLEVESQETATYPPNRKPAELLMITILAPLLSHNEWNVSAPNPS